MANLQWQIIDSKYRTPVPAEQVSFKDTVGIGQLQQQMNNSLGQQVLQRVPQEQPIQSNTPIQMNVQNPNTPVSLGLANSIASTPISSTFGSNQMKGLSYNKFNPEEMKMSFYKYGKERGMTDEAIGTALGLIDVESGFIPKSENNYTAQNLKDFRDGKRGKGYSTFMKRLAPYSNAQLDELAKNPEAVFNLLYDGRNGNGKGEGYKYRGMGLLGLTGKANFEAVGKLTGLDLVNHPELANDLKYAVQIAYATAQHTGLLNKMSNGMAIKSLAGSSNIDSFNKRQQAIQVHTDWARAQSAVKFKGK